VANRPVLDHVLERLERVGVDEVICITGHLQDQIKAHLEDRHPELRRTYVEQVEQLGMALLEVGPVLIVFVDTIFEADLGIIERRPDDDGIVWAMEVEDYQRFGVIVTDEDGYMERIVEKPSEPVSRLANIGVYFIRDVDLMFEGIDHVMAGEPTMGEYFLTEAFQYMIDAGDRLFTAEVDGWWDCGKPGTLLETNRTLLERGLANHPSGDGIRVRDPVLVDGGAVLEDVDIGPNVSVARGATVRRSRLRDTIVGEHAIVEDCRLEASLVGDFAEVRGLSGSVNVGDHSSVAGPEGAGSGGG